MEPTTTSPVRAPAAAQTAPEPAVPRLADGVDLIGRFEDSGFREPPYIARRRDGQVVQMPALLYALAEEIDGRRPYREIADRLSHRVRRGVTGGVAEMLVEERLRPLGIVAPPDGATGPELKKVDPLLALRLRTKVVPERTVRAITTVFQPLFATPVVAAAVAAFAALDVWLFGIHGISQSIRHVLYEPALLLMLLAAVVAATAFHEIGHATACRYGGATPGVMGVGIYIVWPAFYTDITDSYRLGKVGRLRTDLGGMYFNSLFALAAGGAYLATGFEPLLLVVLLQTFAIVQQSMPFLRLDGYYILSDLTGVPDILSRIKPVLASLVPRRAQDDRVAELKPWVRVVVSGYVMTLVPVLGFMFLMMLIHAPRVFATGWDSFLAHWDRVGPDFAGGQGALGAVDAVQMVALGLPALGFAYTASRIGRRAGVASWRWSAGNPLRRGAVVAGTAALAGFTAFMWWPHGEYRPIQPGDRGTLLDGIRSAAEIPTGRPALTSETEPGGAPTMRHAEQQQQQPQRRADAASPVAPRRSVVGHDQVWRLELRGRSVRLRVPFTGSTTPPDPGAVTVQPTAGAPAQPPASATSTAPPSTTSTTPTDTTPTDTSTTSTTPTDTTPTNTDTTSTTPTDTTPTNTDTTSTTSTTP